MVTIGNTLFTKQAVRAIRAVVTTRCRLLRNENYPQSLPPRYKSLLESASNNTRPAATNGAYWRGTFAFTGTVPIPAIGNNLRRRFAPGDLYMAKRKRPGRIGQALKAVKNTRRLPNRGLSSQLKAGGRKLLK